MILKGMKRRERRILNLDNKIIFKSNLNVIGGENLNHEGNIKIDLEVRHVVDVTYDTSSHPVFR